MIAREVEKELPKHEIAAPDGYFTGAIASATPAKVAVLEGGAGYQVDSDLGTGSLVHCWVYRERRDAAELIRIFVDSAKQTTEPTRFEVDAGVIARRPYLSTTMWLHVTQNGQKMLGALKLMVASLPDQSVVCAHDQTGYAKTFKTIAGDFIASVQPQNPAPTPYQEVFIAGLAGQTIGYSETVVHEAEAGGAVILEFSSVLIPKGPNLLTVDAANSEVTSTKGLLQSGSYAAVVGGEVKSEFSVERKKKKLVFTGEVEGKSIDATVPAKGVISLFESTRMLEKLTGVGTSKKVKRVRQSKGTLETAALTFVEKRDSGAHVVEMKGEGEKIRVVVRDGKTESFEIIEKDGKPSLYFKRALAEGELPPSLSKYRR